ncbi:cyclase family protein [Sulfurimonas sp. ST-27]|uniref:cyclase family protein n=1 Tax=unclassified Sulfurimonas TaxID=2623549 RepID=UPI003AB52793
MLFLSYILDEHTPAYGNKNKFVQIKKSDILKGDVANDTTISTTVHIGTHIDMPYHFYEKGQTVKDFNADFWVFKKPLIVEIVQEELIINEKLTARLKNITDIGYDILIVKTGICNSRNSEKFWKENYGFHGDIYNFLIENFPSIRVFGFDSISVSSFAYRMIGRESHKRFLNPQKPILLLEDMDLKNISENVQFKEIIVSPLRISQCDGLPCTVFGILHD